MQTLLKFVSGIVLVVLAANLHAQETPDPLCVQAEKIPIPQPGAQPPGASSNCDFLDLYYRGGTQNLRAARYCALQTRGPEKTAQSNDSDDDLGSDVDELMANAVLAMIYAQGKGVAPNLPLAEHFACSMVDWGFDGRDIAHSFEEARKQGALTAPLDICKNPLGRQSNYVCLVRNEGVVAEEVARAEKRFNTGSPQQQAAFHRLIEARDAFLAAHGAEEPNGTTGRVQAAMQDDIDIEHAWAQLLDKYSAGKLPQYSEADFKKADADLNLAYRDARKKTEDCHEQFCLSTDQLQQLERAWIAFRDAWVAYATIRWPSSSANSWRTWLTLEQTEDLKNIED
jgi:uncharacterized protein YecT (DUF1311 family)